MEDITGRRFGRLVVESFHGRKKSRYLWRCMCDCGAEAIVAGDKLRSAQRPTQSCGCLTAEATGQRSLVHGHTKGGEVTPEYQTWRGMIERCSNPKYKHWRLYGARGITVCARWASFENFLADMGPRPSQSHSLDRRNNNGPYDPENCRWATRQEQIRNRRNSVFVTYKGERMTLQEASAASGIKVATLYGRLRAGWDESRLFHHPPTILV
jgi:hypothetical protein